MREMTDETPVGESSYRGALLAAAKKLRDLGSGATPGEWRAEELPPNEGHPYPAYWVTSEYESGGFRSDVTVADCPWREADAQHIAVMDPATGLLLATVFEAWARMLHRDSDLVSRIGGSETLEVARKVLGLPEAETRVYGQMHGKSVPLTATVAQIPPDEEDF